MAKFVIAGRADCPRFARVELLADKVEATLPHFNVHKVTQSSSDWPSWLSEQCSANGWSHASSPIVWRELVDRGGKGLYVGGLEEFTEYTAHYYDIHPDTEPSIESKIAAENQSLFDSDQLKAASAPIVNPLRVCITDASSPIAYHLSQLVATGEVCGQRQKVVLHLYDGSSDGNTELEGLKMELEDLASPLLTEVIVANTLQDAFNSVSTAFILDYPYQGSEVNEEPTKAVVDRYHSYATTIDFSASKDVRVIVSGCHGNLGAGLIAKYATSIQRSKVIAGACLVEQQTKSLLANKLEVNGADIDQVCVWGRTNGPDVLVDVSHSRVHHFNGSVVGPDPYNLPITRCVFDPDWTSKVFPSLLSSRHGAMTGYHSQQSNIKSSLVEAVGLAGLVRRWDGDGSVWVPVGVVSEAGEAYYDVPEGVVVTLPAHIQGGEWVVVQGISLTEDIKVGLTKQVQSLKTELDTALEMIKTSS